jgi:hypothetical protein
VASTTLLEARVMNPLTVRKIMAFGAGIAFVIAVYLQNYGDTFIAIINFAATLFFVFCYYNPEVLLIKSIADLDELLPNLVQQKFLWASLTIGVLSTIWQMTELLASS